MNGPASFMPALSMVEALPVGILALAAGLCGSLIGSFLNVCIYRLPRGLSIVRPRSRCPHCATPIPGYRNVPLVSWLLQRGRTACCGRSIAVRYLGVEAATAVCAIGALRLWGPTIEGFSQFLFAALLIVLFFTDLDLRLLPNAVTLPGTAAGLALSFFRPGLGEPLPFAGWRSAALGAAVGWLSFTAVAALWRKMRGVDAVGGGDVKMMALLGAFLGLPGLLVALLVASLLGSVVGMGIAARYAARRLRAWTTRRPGLPRRDLAAALFLRGLRRLAVPFGCFLAVGGFVSTLWGDALLRWYLALL